MEKDLLEKNISIKYENTCYNEKLSKIYTGATKITIILENNITV